jgi:poly(A) polymerase
LKPKDFDVATNATPEEIKKTLPRSRIIGRRFKLVHFRRGRNLIEIATFRSSDKKRVSKNHQGRVLRDNVYGNIREDAFRRDFKINALYLNINNLEIIDYTGGFKDLILCILKIQKFSNTFQDYLERLWSVLKITIFARGV